jgi:hypothetical protein
MRGRGTQHLSAMSAGFLTFLILVAFLASPFLLQHYLERLPWAPSCPACRSLTREVRSGWWPGQLVPSLAATFLSECTDCGWRGRMRWRWARDGMRGGHRGRRR